MLSKCSFGGNNKNRLCSEEECERCTQRSLHSVIDALRARSIAYVSDTPARQTFIQSNDKRLWFCLKPGCGHKWTATCNDICGKQQGGCPFCSATPKALCPDAKQCDTCLRKTVFGVTSALLARGIQYDSDVPARQTFINCHDMRSWLCLKHDCGHTWSASCNSVCGTQQRGCPFCCVQSKTLCPGDKECNACLRKTVFSATSALLARGIKYNSDTPSSQTFLCSNDKRSWLCLKPGCGHMWTASCASVCGRKRGCPFCSSKVLCPTDKECDICASRSVHGAADALRFRNIAYNSSEFSARETFLNCCVKRSWMCLQMRCGYVWEAAPNSVCGRKQGGCPLCRRKTEAYLFAWFQATFGATNVTHGKSFSWCKHKRVLPFDFAVCIEAHTICIELDGRQHFITLKHHGGRTSDDNRARDVFKSTAALRHGYGLVRVAQEDVWQDSWPVWRTELEKAIRALSQPQMGTVGDRIAYLSSDPALYEAHKRDQVAALADSRALEDMLSTLPDDVLEGADDPSDALDASDAPTPSPSLADESLISEADIVAKENVVTETSCSAPSQSTTPPDTLAGKKRRASGCTSLDAWLRTGSTKSQRTTHS
jgi:very-short-patch-repair endonuclease